MIQACWIHHVYYAVTYMQKIRSFFAFEQKISNFFLDMDLVSKYSLVVFALLFIHSFRVEHDYLVNSTHLY